MAKTRSTIRSADQPPSSSRGIVIHDDTQGTNPEGTTILGPTISSIVVQGTSRQTEGTTEDPQGSGLNPQLQSVTTPVMAAALSEFQTVTTVVPLPATQNLDASLPLDGRNRLLYNPGMEPNKRYYEWYTDDDETTDVDMDVNHRHHRIGKEPTRKGNPPESRRPSGGVHHQQSYEERIRAHEQSIIQLRKDMERQRERRTLRRRTPSLVNLDLTPPRRRTANREPRADPTELMPLGDPDDPIPPFTEEIMNEPISRRFKMPTIKTYDGAGDPANHVRTFSNALLLLQTTDAIKCRAFPQTLGGMAQRWYSRLPPNSVGSFKDLSKAFISQFISGKTHEKSSASLMNIEQGRNETLRDYLNRFTKEALKVPDLDQKVAMVALQQGTSDVYFKRSLAKHPPEDMQMLQERAGKYIKAEESLRKTVPTSEGNTKKRKGDHSYGHQDEYQRAERDSDSAPKSQRGPRFTEYSRLNTPRSQILMEIEKDKDVRWPKALRTDPEKRNKSLYCRFHKDTGHNTDDCRQLKDEIEYLIRKGKLNKYTKGDDKVYDNQRRDYDDGDRKTQPRGPVINMIFGGPTAAGTSKNSRKAYAREVMHIVGEAPKRARTEVSLMFDDTDLEGVKFPHDDPLVITPVIGNSSVKRVLVDNGASVDILFHDAFLRMGYDDSQLTPSKMPIYGFNGSECNIEGIIQLPVTIGQEPREATQMLNFLVVKAPSTYNAILGRTGLHAFKAIASTYHLKIKFPTRNGVGEEKGDQKVARSCYVAALKQDGVGGQVLPIEEFDARENEKRRGKPAEDLVPINLVPGDQEKVTYVGATLSENSRKELTTFLQNNSDVFAWTAADMPRINPDFITHKLNIIHSPKASGRLIKWAIEFGEFDIQFKPRVAIKAQALADFIVECTINDQEVGGQEKENGKDESTEKEGKIPQKEFWLLCFDGASKTNTSGAGLVL